MQKKSIEQTIPQADGSPISITTGLLARQANGAVVVRKGNAMLLATAVMKKGEEPIGFVPLSIDYREKYYAGGKIPGGWQYIGYHRVITSRTWLTVRS